MEISPHETLLHIRILINDARFERRKVCCGAGGEHVYQRALKVGITCTSSDGTAYRCEIQFERAYASCATGQTNQFDVEARGLTCTGTNQAIRPNETNVHPVTHF